HSSLPVNEVALACGFADPSSFARAFKEHFGLTPRSLRNVSRDHPSPLASLQELLIPAQNPRNPAQMAGRNSDIFLLSRSRPIGIFLTERDRQHRKVLGQLVGEA